MLIRQAVWQWQQRGRRQQESHGHGRGAAGACDLPPGLRPPPAQRGRGSSEGDGLPSPGGGGGRGRERGPGSRASRALPGSLPPSPAPGCLGWQGLGDSHEPVTTATAGGGGGRQTRAPGSRQMGLQNAEGCILEQDGAAATPRGKTPPGGASYACLVSFPLPFYRSASHRQRDLLPEKVVLE